ncbi:hypothetical protein [Streptomyces griseorubiginosus]|uniref:hypothetical protein n=1 Tax=Streptomyces griseorubiginosus TaxID=67304 RepID=UPI002E81F2DB|nr:hypothetical protein [Streptomyces griseorubiginosus]WUB50174.1 hypothetical protein OHN19_38765 [Streptomyces griseorubiginosus]WUB58700.1 hypothetical protein OG942_38775 [Streptomyces griseorubiginosus]
MKPQLPPAVPEVVAAAVEGLTSRLRKKLDTAVESYAALPVAELDGTLSVKCGEDAEVTLTPGPSGTLTDAEQAVCGCLLAPRCLHLAAILSACPVAEPTAADDVSGAEAEPPPADEPPSTEQGAFAQEAPATEVLPGPTRAQVAAATGLRAAAAAVLAAGIPTAGAVPQAELLRAAHTARLAGLHRAEAAALRVVRGVRAARTRKDGPRLAGLVADLRELLLTTHRLASADPDPALVGTARRTYRAGGALKVFGVCREPVLSATGYGGVVTHLATEDGRWFSVADVKPGGPARARAAGTAPVALGSGALDHARLARGGLLISGATISPEGRLGSGRGVMATPLDGLPWTSGPLAALFGRPLREVVADRLAMAPEEPGGALIGCDLVVVGAAGEGLLARELHPDAPEEGPLIRLLPAHAHPDLAHTANFAQLAARPGIRVRVIGRMDPDRAATLRPLAVGPVPDTEATLRLPADRLDRVDLGYDRLGGTHFPDVLSPVEGLTGAPADPLADSPLWRMRRLVELAVAGGRRAVAEPARDGDRRGSAVALRRGGFGTMADLATALTAEADRRTRDVFGRLADADSDPYALVWLSAAVHLAGAERALVKATW